MAKAKMKSKSKYTGNKKPISSKRGSDGKAPASAVSKSLNVGKSKLEKVKF